MDVASASSSSASGLLGAALSDADHRDREAMNLKMEIAHLRERLLMRVGGDASAAALEAETFALKAALLEAQDTAARAQQSLQTLDAKYAKALRNLSKMDQAWKSSGAELQAVKHDAQTRKAAARALQSELETLKQTHASDAAKRQTLVEYQSDKIQALEAAVRQKETEASIHGEQLQRLTLQIKELESERVATRQRHESGAQQSVAKEEYDALASRHQQAMEAAAGLRGEANALRDERASLQSQLSDTKASLTAAMAKFLQLKEENATLEVRVAAANEKSGQSERDAAFYRSEVDRIQSELSKREEEMLQLERNAQVLQLKLSQQQKLTEDAVLVRDHEAKRLELKQELSWKDKEFAMEKEVRALKQQCETMRTNGEMMKQLQEELRATLSGGAGSSNSSTQDLRTLVENVIAQKSDALSAAQHQQKHVSRLEKEVARLKSLTEENAALKSEYEKTRAAMERMVGRKSKSSANPLRFASGSSATATARRGTITATPATVSSASGSTAPRVIQHWLSNEKENNTADSAASNAPGLSGTKRKLVLPPSNDPGTRTAPTSSAGTIFSPRSKRVVHVASRYMQPGASKR